MKTLVLLGFTVLREKLLDGTKTQTIRFPRKRPFKVGDNLQVYWKPRTKQCEKLFDAKVTKIETKALGDVDEQDAIKDGFNCLLDFRMAFFDLHPDLATKEFGPYSEEVDIITFERVKI
jgi:hypothetical protein